MSYLTHLVEFMYSLYLILINSLKSFFTQLNKVIYDDLSFTGGVIDHFG
jgi:hypothetical protein